MGRSATNRLASVILLMALVGWVSVINAQPALASTDYKVWHFNMCGNNCANGSLSPVTPIKNSLTASGDVQDFVTLVEVCRNQYDSLMSSLGAGWNGDFVKTLDATDYSGLCDASGTEYNYGNAVIIRAAKVMGSTVTTALPDGDASIKEHRHLICITADLATDVRVCSVHIAPLSVWTNLGYSSAAAQTRQDSQITTAKNTVAGFSNPVVWGGDFNAEPSLDALDQIYDNTRYGGGATGKFQEIDEDTPGVYGGVAPCRCGANTYSQSSPTKKIDYIFFTKASFVWLSGTVTSNTAGSDHKILRGTVRL